MTWMSRLITFLFLLLLGLSIANAAPADAKPSGPDAEKSAVPASLTPDAMKALVDKLEPEQVNALGQLMKLLGDSVDSAALQAAAGTPSAAQILRGWISGFQASVGSHIRALPDLFRGAGKAIASIFAGRSTAGTLSFLGMVTLALAIGAAVEWLFSRTTARSREKIRSAKTDTLRGAVQTLYWRVVFELGAVAAFVVGALVANRLLVADPTDRLLVSAFVLNAILIVRVIATLLRFVLAPHRPDLRLVSTDDWTSRYLYRNFTSIAGVAGVAFWLAEILELKQMALTGTLRFWVSLILSTWLMYTIWRARRGLSSILIGEESNLTPGLARMAAWWPGVTMFIIGFNWVFLQFVLSTGNAALTPGRGALAMVLIVVAPFLDTMVRGIATHLVPAMRGEGPVAEAAYQETRLCYVRMGRVVLLTVLILVVGKLWGLSLRNLADAGFGAQLAADAVGFLLTIAVGYLAWEMLNLWTNRQLANDQPGGAGQSEQGEKRSTGRSRLGTVLPILHMTLQVTIIALTVLLGLSQLGVNTTPLLAGAGVFGLAIGFGAQTLVKDIVSGVFFLLDDAFRVGEYIDVGGTMGTVEKISIRSLQLRGATGPVHVIPYGTMSQLTNLSRDWVIMKLRFTVPFDTDLEKVRKIFKKVGQQINENPEYAANLIAPFKSQGAGDVTDVGIVVRGKFTAKPGTQFPIRKEIYSRIQKAFKENGIEFARREVRVRMPDAPDGAPLSAETKAAISTAAIAGDAAARG